MNLSDWLWVAPGERPPARSDLANGAAEMAPVPRGATGDGGWPAEPRPDVDSEG
jgi:hypothetical protein